MTSPSPEQNPVPFNIYYMTLQALVVAHRPPDGFPPNGP